MGKNLLNSNISPTCPRNMVNFSPLAAEILSLVWGTSANFNGFRVFAALLHGTPAAGVAQTLRCRTEGTTYILAGRPSRWASAHILVVSTLHCPIPALRWFKLTSSPRAFHHCIKLPSITLNWQNILQFSFTARHCSTI